MTRGIAETRRRLVAWPLKYDAHTWPRNDNRRTLRPTGRVEYGYNRVQEIVSGTPQCLPDFMDNTELDVGVWKDALQGVR